MFSSLPKWYTPLKTWSSAIELILVSLFALLWAIWIQPHTIALRQILLTVGSVLGLYVISQNLYLFKTRRAAPIYLIGLLFAWITCHLLFLSQQYELQLAEYLTIWKRIVWGAPFAIGLGIVLGKSSNKEILDQVKTEVPQGGVFWIFYAGIVAPTLIYLIRTMLMLMAGKFGWQLPNFAIHWPAYSTWHIPKMSIVFFCLPALALACSECIRLAGQKTRLSFFLIILHVGIIAAVESVFYLENTKNGFVYSTLLIMVMLVKIAFGGKSKCSWRNSIIIFTVVIGMIFVLEHHIERNNSWLTLAADIQLTKELEKIDAWKDYGARGYPVNEMNTIVSETNYLRAAWARIALGFIVELPQGYGLVYQSFGYYAKTKWSDSNLFQAHSAWLDLILGIGIPGVFLLVLAGALGLKNASQIVYRFWGMAAFWILLSIALLMITTEVSQRIYLDTLVFLVLWAAGLGLNYPSRLNISSAPVKH